MSVYEFRNLVCQIHYSCVKMALWIRAGLPVNHSDVYYCHFTTLRSHLHWVL